jgi:SAM-dependent methyltransferase
VAALKGISVSSTISRPPVSALQGYDLWATTYDSFNNPMLAMVDRAFEMNSPNFAGNDVLELGCGTGRNIRRVLTSGAKSYTGLDQSAGMLKVAQDKNPGATVKLVEANLDSVLPFESERFDFILVTLVFEHVPFLLPVLAEAHRVLKPGGKIRILEIHSGLVENGTGAHFEHNGETYDLPSFPHPALEWEATLTRAGFEIRHIKDLYADSQAIDRCSKLLKHKGKAVVIDIEAGKA